MSEINIIFVLAHINFIVKMIMDSSIANELEVHTMHESSSLGEFKALVQNAYFLMELSC